MLLLASAPARRRPRSPQPGPLLATRLRVAQAGNAFGHAVRFGVAGLVVHDVAGLAGFGVYAAGAMVGGAAGALLGGATAGRLGCRRMLRHATWLTALAQGGVLAALALHQAVVAVAVIAAVAHALALVVGTTVKIAQVELSDGHNIGAQVARVNAYGAVGWSLGSATAGLLWLPGSLALAVTAAAIALVALAPFAALSSGAWAPRVLPAAGGSRPRLRDGLAALVANWRIVGFSLLLLVLSTGPLGLSAGLIEQLADARWVSLGALAAGSASLAAAMVLRRLRDPRRIELRLLTVSAVAALLAWLLPAPTGLLTAVMVGALAMQVHLCRLEALLSRRVGEAHRPLAQGLVSTCQQLGMAGGVLLLPRVLGAAPLTAHSERAALQVTVLALATLVVAAAACAAVVRRGQRQRGALALA